MVITCKVICILFQVILLLVIEYSVELYGFDNCYLVKSVFLLRLSGLKCGCVCIYLRVGFWSMELYLLLEAFFREVNYVIRIYCTEYSFFSLKIINPKNIDKSILEILDQNRINIEVILLYFSTNQLKIQNKNILENSAQKLINLGSKINKYMNLIGQEMSVHLNFRTHNKT